MNTSTIAKPSTAPVPERVNARPSIAPACDVYENADGLLLVADVPGVRREGLSVHFDKGTLTIEAKRSRAEAQTLLAREYGPRDYHRVFAVPQGIDGARIEAELVGGILRVKLPKSEALKPRKIEVRAG